MSSSDIIFLLSLFFIYYLYCVSYNALRINYLIFDLVNITGEFGQQNRKFR